MTGRALLGAFLAALIVFVWSFVSHMMLPWWEGNVNGFSNEQVVAEAMLAGSQEDGIYFIPHFQSGDEEGMARMNAGPVAFISLTRGGMDAMGAVPLILQFVVNLLVALLMARLMLCMGEIAFSVKLRLAVVIAVIASLMFLGPYWIWYGFAPGFVFVTFMDLLIGWFLGGLVLARFTK